jgi:hypothetical protein
LVDISNTEFSNCVELNSMFDSAQVMELNMIDTQADNLDETQLLGRSHIWIVRKVRDENRKDGTCETKT